MRFRACFFDVTWVAARELISINVGGFGGAPLRGELGSYRELYSGESGPRVELLELLDWVGLASPLACTAVNG